MSCLPSLPSTQRDIAHSFFTLQLLANGASQRNIPRCSRSCSSIDTVASPPLCILQRLDSRNQPSLVIYLHVSAPRKGPAFSLRSSSTSIPIPTRNTNLAPICTNPLPYPPWPCHSHFIQSARYQTKPGLGTKMFHVPTGSYFNIDSGLCTLGRRRVR